MPARLPGLSSGGPGVGRRGEPPGNEHPAPCVQHGRGCTGWRRGPKRIGWHFHFPQGCLVQFCGMPTGKLPGSLTGLGLQTHTKQVETHRPAFPPWQHRTWMTLCSGGRLVPCGVLAASLASAHCAGSTLPHTAVTSRHVSRYYQMSLRSKSFCLENPA